MTWIAAVDSINALAKLKKARVGVNRISLKFRVAIGITQRRATFPVETRRVKFSNQNNTKIECIQLVL
jgi:hypothetical protein